MHGRKRLAAAVGSASREFEAVREEDRGRRLNQGEDIYLCGLVCPCRRWRTGERRVEEEVLWQIRTARGGKFEKYNLGYLLMDAW